MKKRLIWFSWKDLKHPRSGGAEIITDFHLKNLSKKGFKVFLLTSSFKNAKKKEKNSHYTVIRFGNYFTCQIYYFFKFFLNFKFKKDDFIFEEINTIPFYIFLIKKNNIKLFFHQLTEIIWFYETIFPISIFGFIFEKINLKFISKKSIKIIVPSNSTKNNLINYGVKKNLIFVSENLNFFKPNTLYVPNAKTFVQKKIITFIGEIRKMKRLEQIISIYRQIKKIDSEVQLKIIGISKTNYAKNLILKNNDINFLGFVDNSKKIEILKKTSFLISCSVKEGWGLTITEANQFGTPAIVYKVDGLIDSVRDGHNGIIIEDGNKKEMIKMIDFYLQPDNHPIYIELRRKTHNHYLNQIKSLNTHELL